MLSASPDALVVSEWIVRCLVVEVETRVAGSTTWERLGPDMDSSGPGFSIAYERKREKLAEDVQFSV